MSKNFRSIWLYAVIVFGMAILLILVSTVSLTRLPADSSGDAAAEAEQKQFNQTIQQSLSEMTAQSNQLRDQLCEMEEEIIALQQENRALQSQRQTLNRANDTLSKAVLLYMNQQYAEARDTLQTVSSDTFTEQGVQLYETLKNQLSRKGYAFK